MTTFTVEHTTYNRGATRSQDHDFATEAEAQQSALYYLQVHGGRVWINNKEYKRKELECILYPQS